MDLVVNHTSDEHEWFQKSRQRIDPYTDYLEVIHMQPFIGNGSYEQQRHDGDDKAISEDVFVARRDRRTGEWGTAMVVQGLNNPYRNEAPTSISGDGKTMLVFVEGRMCFSQKIQGGWSEPTPFPSYLQLGNWQADAMIVADGSAILFAANYPAACATSP